jgi:hypothetical protein
MSGQLGARVVSRPVTIPMHSPEAGRADIPTFVVNGHRHTGPFDAHARTRPRGAGRRHPPTLVRSPDRTLDPSHL